MGETLVDTWFCKITQIRTFKNTFLIKIVL